MCYSRGGFTALDPCTLRRGGSVKEEKKQKGEGGKRDERVTSLDLAKSDLLEGGGGWRVMQPIKSGETWWPGW